MAEVKTTWTPRPNSRRGTWPATTSSPLVHAAPTSSFLTSRPRCAGLLNPPGALSLLPGRALAFPFAFAFATPLVFAFGAISTCSDAYATPFRGRDGSLPCSSSPFCRLLAVLYGARRGVHGVDEPAPVAWLLLFSQSLPPQSVCQHSHGQAGYQAQRIWGCWMRRYLPSSANPELPLELVRASTRNWLLQGFCRLPAALLLSSFASLQASYQESPPLPALPPSPFSYGSCQIFCPFVMGTSLPAWRLSFLLLLCLPSLRPPLSLPRAVCPRPKGQGPRRQQQVVAAAQAPWFRPSQSAHRSSHVGSASTAPPAPRHTWCPSAATLCASMYGRRRKGYPWRYDTGGKSSTNLSWTLGNQRKRVAS